MEIFQASEPFDLGTAFLEGLDSPISIRSFGPEMVCERFAADSAFDGTAERLATKEAGSARPGALTLARTVLYNTLSLAGTSIRSDRCG